MASAKAPAILAVAAVLLALLVGIVLWATSSSAPAPAAPPEAPGPKHVPVTGTVGLESSEPESVRAAPVDRPAPETTEDASPFAPHARVSATGPTLRLSGIVRRRGGAPAPEGTLVLARNVPTPRNDAEIVQRFLRHDACPEIARTGEDGSFRFENLPRGALYHLSAAGQGAVSLEPPVTAYAGAGDVRLELCMVYGIALELKEEGGGPLRSTIEVVDVALPRTPFAAPLPDTPLLALAGVDLASYRSAWNRRLYLFTSARLEEPLSLDKIPVRVRIAGYVAKDTAYDALPVSAGLTQHDVELHPSAAGFGEIVLQFTDGDDPTVDAPKTRSWRLQLASTIGTQSEVELPRERGPKRLGGIPYGRYRLSLLNCIDQEIWPRRANPGEPVAPVDLGDRPLAIDVSLADTSTLEVSIGAANAAVAYQGPANFSLARGEPTADRRSVVGSTATVTFDHPPYLVAGLRSGHYVLFVQEPAGAILDPKEAPVLELAPSQRTSVRLVLP
jgi:hypothetical protein